MALRASDEEDTTTTPPPQSNVLLDSVLRAASKSEMHTADLNGDGNNSGSTKNNEECHNSYQHQQQEDIHVPTPPPQVQQQQQMNSSLTILAAEIDKVVPLVNRVKQGGFATGKQLAEMMELLSRLMLMTVDVMKVVAPQVKLNLEVLPADLGLTPTPQPLGYAKADDQDLSPGTIKYASPGSNFASPEATTSKDDSGKKAKRKRTKFTDEQRAKLEALANKASWVLANLTKEEQEQAADELGIKVDSLKYWFHNTKQKQGKKQKGSDEARG